MAGNAGRNPAMSRLARNLPELQRNAMNIDRITRVAGLGT
jgi:hypothetical protein